MEKAIKYLEEKIKKSEPVVYENSEVLFMHAKRACEIAKLETMICCGIGNKSEHEEKIQNIDKVL